MYFINNSNMRTQEIDIEYQKIKDTKPTYEWNIISTYRNNKKEDQYDLEEKMIKDINDYNKSNKYGCTVS